jgi:hypothetical protein
MCCLVLMAVLTHQGAVASNDAFENTEVARRSSWA